MTSILFAENTREDGKIEDEANIQAAAGTVFLGVLYALTPRLEMKMSDGYRWNRYSTSLF